MIVDEQLTQGWAGSDVQDHWKTEEVMEQLTAARAVKNEQGEVTQGLNTAYKALEEVHNLLVHQFLKLIASTENLKCRIFRMREQHKYGTVIREKGYQ